MRAGSLSGFSAIALSDRRDADRGLDAISISPRGIGTIAPAQQLLDISRKPNQGTA
ncbi:MAG: hypothetical protein J7647_18070 [Cyanobacteria bacterium SBLK]|nr:hypothetical protein [Cyanobacteria bacterium SBLK]